MDLEQGVSRSLREFVSGRIAIKSGSQDMKRGMRSGSAGIFPVDLEAK